MLTIKIVCVGKVREKFYADGCAEYKKRLSRFAKIEIIEVVDEKAPETLSHAQMEQVKTAEGERLLSKLASDDFIIALCIDGESLSSLQFADKLQTCMTSGVSHIAFVIGGSLGLSQEVIARANCKLSFSRFTFSHQLMRVVLLEQVYRAMKILANEPYHK